MIKKILNSFFHFNLLIFGCPVGAGDYGTRMSVESNDRRAIAPPPSPPHWTPQNPTHPPLEIWELNSHFGSNYYWSDNVSHYVPIITEQFSAQDRTLIISVKYRLLCKDVHQSSVGSKKWVWQSTLVAPPPTQTKIVYQTAFHAWTLSLHKYTIAWRKSEEHSNVDVLSQLLLAEVPICSTFPAEAVLRVRSCKTHH